MWFPVFGSARRGFRASGGAVGLRGDRLRFSWIQGALGWVRASGGAVGLRARRGDRLRRSFLVQWSWVPAKCLLCRPTCRAGSIRPLRRVRMLRDVGSFRAPPGPNPTTPPDAADLRDGRGWHIYHPATAHHRRVLLGSGTAWVAATTNLFQELVLDAANFRDGKRRHV